MIEITRSLARAYRALLKKLARGGHRDAPTAVVFQTDRTGMHIRAGNALASLQYTQAGSHDAEEIAVPAEALAEFESRKDGPVRLEKSAECVTASWQEGVVPQVRRYDLTPSDRLPALPPTPARMETQPAELLKALVEASTTAGTDAIRYAINCIQLRGKSGKIVATDAHQMLSQEGFTFPWDKDVLIPALPAFGCRELAGYGPITIGCTDSFMALTVGPWTFHLAIDMEGRFPQTDSIVQGTGQAPTVFHVHSDDAEFLLGTLDSLPGAVDGSAPITVDGNGSLIIRARGDSQPAPTEVVLARSAVQGKNVRFAMERTHLERALRLGFRDVNVQGADLPLICSDNKRRFVCQVLDSKSALKASENAIRLSSTDGMAAPVPPVKSGQAEQPVQTMPATTSGAAVPTEAPPATRKRRVKEEPLGHESSEANGNGAGRPSLAAVITETEALKDLFRQGYTRTHQILVSVRRYRKQEQAVRSALGSLRQLQEVAQ